MVLRPGFLRSRQSGGSWVCQLLTPHQPRLPHPPWPQGHLSQPARPEWDSHLPLSLLGEMAGHQKGKRCRGNSHSWIGAKRDQPGQETEWPKCQVEADVHPGCPLSFWSFLDVDILGDTSQESRSRACTPHWDSDHERGAWAQGKQLRQQG